MGKKGGSSWLSAVKRAFRSPSKDAERGAKKRREDQEVDDEEKVSFLVILYSCITLYILLLMASFCTHE